MLIRTIALVSLVWWVSALALPSASAETADELPLSLPTVRIGTLDGAADLFGEAVYLRDSEDRLDLAGVLRSRAWKPFAHPELNQGISADAFWIAFRLVNDTPMARRLVVSHDLAQLSHFAVYAIADDGTRAGMEITPAMPLESRPLAYGGSAAPVAIPAGEARDVVVKLRNDFAVPMHIGVRVWTERAFERHVVRQVALYAFWTASLLTNALFWLLYGIVMWRWRLLFYALYMLSIAYTYGSFFGIGYPLLYPDQSWLCDLGYHWTMFSALAAALEFARRHLEVGRLHPRHNLVLQAGVRLCLAAMIFALVARRPEIEAPITFALFAVVPLYITFLSWQAWRRDGIAYARWMVIGWAAVAVSLLLAVFGGLFVVPGMALTPTDYVRLTFVCTVCESILLSISLAQWLRGLDKRLLIAEEAAARDALTGLMNRRGFEESVALLMSDGRWPGDLWLAMIDVDRFKSINDRHSHPAGDAVLVHLAGLMQRQRQQGDLAVRFGGEEFLLVFASPSGMDASARLERLRRRFAETPTAFGEERIEHTFSAGLVPVADGLGADVATTLARADDALYAAKRLGRNRVHLAVSIIGSPGVIEVDGLRSEA
ncbi:diguanylate cyclase [Acuticoccus mangrovi]|uniref:diguanylate cyclase n=1 Tax=Acuticoccus mangrovi TaxID=2796142 RepID=A0A934MHG3_9HYPH|nr:diguanylate cyclase [Acuticoccus mangrovi]MBJ3777628.1 GGDEF domain-containing protein [Acuticoccus mangrovi]